MVEAGKGNLEAVQLALRHDPDLPQWQQIKGSALGAAARGGHIEIVRLLLEHKPPVGSTRAPGKYTPLHYAAQAGHLQVARLLLQHKAPLDAQTHDGETALIFAARRCHLELLKLLLDAGAALELQGGRYKHTALCAAVESDKSECIAELGRRGANSAVIVEYIGPSSANVTPLFAAVGTNKPQVVKALLDTGADPNLVRSGQTPLFEAARTGNAPIVTLLLAAKADPHRIDDEGGTPLMRAAESGDKQTVELLLLAKAQISAVDRQGVTPLLYAARRHRKQATMALLAAGADPLILSRQGERALEFLLVDMNQDAPELRPLLAKYLNKKGLPKKPLPPLPKVDGKPQSK